MKNKIPYFFKRIKALLERVELSLKVLRNRKEEPFVNFKILMEHVFKPKITPLRKQINFENQFIINKHKVNYRGYTIHYPEQWDSKKIKRNFNAILNEQTEGSPHQYFLSKEIKRDCVVYDIGVAEGLQALQWSEKAGLVVLFEPDPAFFSALQKTFFEKENVILINKGVSNEKKQMSINGERVEVDSLENIVDELDLPKPDFIKVDIEGEELSFLKGAGNLLKSVGYIEICTYHRPNDWQDIPKFLNNSILGEGAFSDGVMFYNNDGMISGTLKKIYHPVFRKALYRFKNNFNTKCNVK